MNRKHVGELSAITRSIKMIGAGLGPALAGILSDVLGLNYIFLAGAIIFVGILVYFWIISRDVKHRKLRYVKAY